MTQKIFRSVFIAALMVLLASFVLIFGALYSYSNTAAEKQLKVQVGLAAQGVETEGEKYLDGLRPDGCRITWIDSDGRVLYESSNADAAKMENHLEREEVKQALATGYGQSRRYSSTLMEKSLYAAQKLSDGTVIRLSMSQGSALAVMITMAQPAAAILVFAVFFSIFLASRLSRRVVKPLNNIDLDHPDDNEGYDELAPLLHRISTQQAQLEKRRAELEGKQEELSTILENMSEGMILIRSNNHILSINTAAIKITGADGVKPGSSVLTLNRNLEFQNAVQNALMGNYIEKIIAFGSGQYQMTASPVMKEGNVQGAVVVLIDVTERIQAEQMRREFSANVSHELKTPLHSISGYAELMKNGMVKENDIKPFAGKIFNEAQRMISLVEDIISLSHLDEGAGDMVHELTDLNDISQNAARDLREEASGSDITVTVAGESAELVGIPALLTTAVRNLLDNSIKYNRAGGHVTLTTHSDGDNVSLTVADNGIGIPEADQKRIFERFYRVDKSHSRAIGGTGLGLSIVKHAAMIHNGSIDLKSKVGEGTTITITLPKDMDKS